jgi:flagellar hook-basal body complex protein FliE
MLASAIGGVENTQRESGRAVERLLSGEGQELHATVLATQRAELTFNLLVQVRNKVVQAYQEIMRMQI